MIGIFICLLMPTSTNALVKPTDEFYINDYADILTKETEEYILDLSLIHI